MKTSDLKTTVALWLGRLELYLPESWAPLVRWVAWRLVGCDSKSVSALSAVTTDTETFIPTAQQILVVRFVRLPREMSNEEIESMLRDRNLEPAAPEHMDALAQNRDNCPDGRTVAVGGDGESVRVCWKQGRDTFNMFWFPRNVPHFAGDLAVGIAS